MEQNKVDSSSGIEQVLSEKQADELTLQDDIELINLNEKESEINIVSQFKIHRPQKNTLLQSYSRLAQNSSLMEHLKPI